MLVARVVFSPLALGIGQAMSEEASGEAIGETLAAFRAANERLQAAADAIGLTLRLPFICECPDPACMELVSLTFDQYEAVRTHPRRFFTTVSHEQIATAAGAAVLVEEHPDYVVVEAIGAAGVIADESHA